MRIDAGRCTGCDAWVVDGYFCYECAIRSAFSKRHDEDQRSPTATALGRSMRLHQEICSDMQDLVDLMGSGPDSNSHHLRREASPAPWRFTAEEHARIDRHIGAPMLVAHVGGNYSKLEFASAKLRRRARLGRRAHNRWGAFCASWTAIARAESPSTRSPLIAAASAAA